MSAAALFRRLSAALVLAASIPAAPASAADHQLRPFFGGTFAGGTTFVDLENAAGKPNPVVGISVVTLGDVFGLDVDVGDAPGFFQSGDRRLVLSSRVTTVTGNVVIAAPRRLTEYSLRPYLVAGAGVMRLRSNDYFGGLNLSTLVPSFDIGAGAVGFLTDMFGVGWEVRRFQSFSEGTEEDGLTLGKRRLSFWRASMSLAIRY